MGRIIEMGVFPVLSGLLPIGRSVSPSMLKVKETISLSAGWPAIRALASVGISIHFKTGLEQEANKNTVRNVIADFFIRASFLRMFWQLFSRFPADAPGRT
jgi:hypothetical protein